MSLPENKVTVERFHEELFGKGRIKAADEFLSAIGGRVTDPTGAGGFLVAFWTFTLPSTAILRLAEVSSTILMVRTKDW